MRVEVISCLSIADRPLIIKNLITPEPPTRRCSERRFSREALYYMCKTLLKNTYAAIVALFIAMMALPTTAQAQTDYDFKICGTWVTSDNCDDLSVIDGVSGKVSYDPNTNTLTLKEATIKNTDKESDGIVNLNDDDLTIRLIGNNVITSENSGGIFNNVGQITFTGDGKLTVEGSTKEVKYRHGILCAGAGTIIVSGCTLIVSGGSYGLRNGQWKFDRCTVYAKGGGTSDDEYRGSISYLPNKPEFIGCDIIDPIGTYWETSNGRYYLFGANGKVVTDWVKIGPVTEYDLNICGTQVNSANCDDLSVIDGVEGTVKYDHKNNILTLENATINAGGGFAIHSEIDDLTINVIGTNNITSINYSAVKLYSPTTITGGGTFSVDCTAEASINAINSDRILTIKDCTVNAQGRCYGIKGDSSYPLVIKNATVTAEGREEGSIFDFNEITLEDCAITQPAGAAFDESKHAVVLNGEVVTSEVKIEPVTEYKLWIAGTQVTSANCDDLSVIDGVEGTVKYDPNTKILTLKDAKLNAEYNILSKIDGLTIKVSGTNEVNATGAAICFYSAPATITGGGTLNVKGQESCGIYVQKTNLTIKDCIVNAKGRWGIIGSSGSEEKLLISNATVRVEGENGSICGLKEITLEDCAITQPAGAVFDESKHAVVLNGEVVTSEVKIEPVTEYKLFIRGTRVTSANCNDLSVIDGVEGTVKYDPNTNILTLKDAIVNAKEGYACIYSWTDGLTIEVNGTNELNTGDVATIYLEAPTTITGGGTLNAKSKGNCAIYAEGTDLTIKDCIVNAKGVYGITGRNGSTEKLLISKATVTAEGREGSICDFASLTLEYSNITQPSGARFDEAKHAVVLNGEVVTSKIVITRDPAGIDTPTINTAAKQGIYTLSGVKLNGEVKDLPKGIYIVNGKKFVKK